MSVGPSSIRPGNGAVMPHLIRRWHVRHHWWEWLVPARHRFYIRADCDDALRPTHNGDQVLDWLDDYAYGGVVVSAIMWAGIATPRCVELRFTHLVDATAAKLRWAEIAIED